LDGLVKTDLSKRLSAIYEGLRSPSIEKRVTAYFDLKAIIEELEQKSEVTIHMSPPEPDRVYIPVPVQRGFA
jgi:hypothetical protein